MASGDKHTDIDDYLAYLEGRDALGHASLETTRRYTKATESDMEMSFGKNIGLLGGAVDGGKLGDS